MAKNLRIAAGTAALTASVLLVVAMWQPTTATGEAVLLVGGHGDHRGSAVSFTLDAVPIQALYPGAVRQMKVTLINKLGYRLRLQKLSGKVVASSRRGCPATVASLKINEYNGPLPVSIAPRSRTSLRGTIPVAMPAGASQRCAGARFTIALSGLGYRADR
jgi:hypothetical protein